MAISSAMIQAFVLLIVTTFATVLGCETNKASYPDLQHCSIGSRKRSCTDEEADIKQRLGSSRSGLELIREAGFQYETHNVTSPDGYITTLIRIPHGRFQNSSTSIQKKVVLLHHGFIADGFCWILNSVDKALAYRLADLGDVDVWITNNRGTYYSLDHIELSWANHQYWNFSFHEIGHYDVPLIIDYVLNVTGEKDLYYVGHSMGGTSLVVALHHFPEYNTKIRTFIGLAPAIFVGNTSAPFEPLIPLFMKQQEFFDSVYVQPFITPAMQPFMSWVGNICSNRIVASWMCFALLETVYGYDFQETNYDLSGEIFRNALSSASMKTLFHLLQLWTSGNFRFYDYLKRNLDVYGIDDPHHYDLSRVKIPVVLFCGKDDNLVSCLDVRRFGQSIPNLKEFTTITWKKFNHIDFLFATHINSLLNDRIVQIIRDDIFYAQ